VDSTRLSSQLDPEEYREVVRAYHRSYAAARTCSRAGNASCRPWRMRRRLSCRQVHPWSRRSRSTSTYATRHKAI
jgi:hypothetical protein